MNYLIIKSLAEHKNVSLKNLSKEVGITEQGLYQMIRNQSIKVDVLEKIAEVLEVPINVFFEDSTVISKKIIGDNNKVILDSPVTNSNNNTNSNNPNEGSVNVELLEAKNEIIKNLKTANNHYDGVVNSLFYDFSNLYVNIVEKYPKMKDFLKEQKTTTRFLARINTTTVFSENKPVLNQKFFDYFENPY